MNISKEHFEALVSAGNYLLEIADQVAFGESASSADASRAVKQWRKVLADIRRPSTGEFVATEFKHLKALRTEDV